MRNSCRTASSRGFTFVELLVAVTLLVIGFLGVYASLSASALLRETASETNIAAFKMQSEMEYIFSLPFDDIKTVFPPGTPVNIAPFLDGDPQNNFSLPSEQVTVTYPDASPDPLQFVIAVTWTSRVGAARTASIACARSR